MHTIAVALTIALHPAAQTDAGTPTTPTATATATATPTAPATATATASATMFPRVADVEPLTGNRIANFPADLPGTTRVIIVAFERDRSDALDQWLTRARALEKTRTDMHVVAAPFIGDVNVMLKSVILIAQRGAVPTLAQPRMMPLFISRENAASALGLKLTDTAALVVNKRGEVIARVVGSATDANVAKLASLLAQE